VESIRAVAIIAERSQLCERRSGPFVRAPIDEEAVRGALVEIVLRCLYRESLIVRRGR